MLDQFGSGMFDVNYTLDRSIKPIPAHLEKLLLSPSNSNFWPRLPEKSVRVRVPVLATGPRKCSVVTPQSLQLTHRMA